MRHKQKIISLIAAFLVLLAGYSLIVSRAATVKSADFNNDSTVNVFDLSMLLSKWGTNTPANDLNTDNTINIFDLSILLSQWGTGGAQSGVCPPYPAFPDANCTGWQHTGVTLKAVPGQVTSGTGWEWRGAPFNYVAVLDNNAVLDGLDIAGCVYVDNTVVSTATIKRSRITGNCDYLIRLDNRSKSTAISVIDTELVGSAVQQTGSGFSWLRVNAHGFSGKAAMTENNTVVEDSWVHDNTCTPPDHQSGIGTNGAASNIVMRHNNVDLTPSECTSGGISNYDDFGPFSNVLIEKNLINSAAYCLKAGFEEGAASGSNMSVINNVFGRKYFPECGSFGPVSNWLNGNGNVWSGNTWGSGAAATNSHQVGDPVSP